MMGNSLIKRNKKNEKTLSRKTNSNKSNENDNKVHTSRHHFCNKRYLNNNLISQHFHHEEERSQQHPDEWCQIGHGSKHLPQ